MPSLRDRLRRAKEEAPAFPEFADPKSPDFSPDYPPTMTLSAVTRLLDLVGTGNYLETAAAVSGLIPRKVHRWLRIGEGREEGEEPREPYSTFAELYRQAEAEAESRIVGAWSAEALVDYRAGAALLARRHPERWGRGREETTQETGIQSIHVHIGERPAAPLSEEESGE